MSPLARTALALLGSLLGPLLLGAQELTIQVINVGWGSSVLLGGPTGMEVLLEAGRPGMGVAKVAPYLRARGITHLDAIVLGHLHLDHGGGLPELAELGYAAPRNYWNGSPGGNGSCRAWVARTGAQALVPGDRLDLGGGATATCIAANGRILGLPPTFQAPASAAPGPTLEDEALLDPENDRSIALLVTYGGFSYLWESDLGGGPDAEDPCSGRRSAQADMEVPMIRAISPGGAHPLLGPQGVDVIHLGHHGSESSTHPVYLRLARPTVALLSTGAGQGQGWALPYRHTIDGVVLAGPEGCAGVPAPLLLQTEDGDQDSGGQRSTSGYAVGNLTVRTDGATFWAGCDSINGDRPLVVEGTLEEERAAAGLAAGAERAFPCKGVPAVAKAD